MAATLILPLGAPLVRSYLFHAFPLAILAGRGDAPLPWILSTFVQLYHRPGGELKFYVHPLSPAPQLRQVLAGPCPWLDVQGIEPHLIDGPPGPFLARCLRQGLFVQVDVDHGRLPGDGRRGFVHEVLVSGLRGDAEAFLISGYDAGGRFGARWVAAADLEAGMRDAMGGAAARGRSAGFLYRVTDGSDFELDPEALATQLWDYVEAADSSRRHREVWPVTGGSWGIAALSWLAEALAAAEAGLTLSLRVLWEHKRLMALRLAHLEVRGHLDPDAGCAAAARGLASAAWTLRLAHLRPQARVANGIAARPPASPDPGHSRCGQAIGADGEAAAARVHAIAARELDLYGAVLGQLGAHRPRLAA